MTEPLTAARRRFAETIGAAAQLPAPLVEAFAAVPRERFLGEGPWLIWREGQPAAQPSPDADPKHVYQNASIAIDASRQLFNGLPSFLGMAIAALGLQPGHRVLHVGPGLGYYTAVMGQLVGPGGCVVGVEVDADLAARAQALVLPGGAVEIHHGTGAETFGQTFDAILVNAGVTHPQLSWLDALGPGGRLVLPLTVTLPFMPASIGKGHLVLVTRGADADFDVRVLSVVAIYSAIGLRDDALGAQLSAAMMRGVAPARLTRRPHPQADACIVHTPEWCLS